MGTKIEPGDFDCYAEAAPDEPLFTLRANDPLAPITVRVWIILYALAKAGRLLDFKNGKCRAKIFEAWRCARSMGEWRRKR